MNLTWVFSLIILQFGFGSPLVQEADFGARLAAYYAKVKTIQADFVQEKESALFDEPLVSKGKFYFQKPDQVRWEQVSPSKNYFVFKQNEFIEFDGKTVKTSTGANPQLSVFRDFILKTVDGSILQDSSFSKSYHSKGGKMHIRLTPVEKRLSKRVESIEMVFDEKSLQLDLLHMTEVGGETTRITFAKQQVDAAISPSLFSK